MDQMLRKWWIILGEEIIYKTTVYGISYAQGLDCSIFQYRLKWLNYHKIVLITLKSFWIKLEPINNFYNIIILINVSCVLNLCFINIQWMWK